MASEFIDQYDKLFQDAAPTLKKAWIVKMKAIKQCRNHHNDI